MCSLFNYETLMHAVAGATGSVVGMATFYPLDTLRSRQQVEDSFKLRGSLVETLLKITNEEGIMSLYQGIQPVLQSLSVSNFVYFYSFHGLRKACTAKKSATHDLLFGVLAGSINVLMTSPLWVVNTRMKLEKNKYNSLLDGLVNVYKTEGFGGLWSGTVPSLLLVSNPAIQFMIYELLKRNLQKIGQFSAFAAFLTAATAKTVATILTYPLQLVQSRLRAGTTFESILRDIKNKPNIMFRGLEAKLWQTVMTTALMFLIYEKVVKLVLTIMRIRFQKH